MISFTVLLLLKLHLIGVRMCVCLYSNINQKLTVTAPLNAIHSRQLKNMYNVIA